MWLGIQQISTNQPTNQSPTSFIKYLSTTPLCFQGETLKRLVLSNGGLLCSVNHGLWVKLFSRWHSPVWANIPKLSTIIILTIRNKTYMVLTMIKVHDDDDFWNMYGQPSFFHSDDQEKMVMLVKRGSRTAIYGQPLFFPSQRTQEPWLLINLIQFPPKWVTSRRPLLRPGTPDTISDRERVHLPYSTNCGDAPGILVILPPAAAIYLIITIHKSHPQSVHPPRGPTPTRRFNFQHARTTISTLPHRSRT